MPRFRLKTMLIVFAVVALWLSTFAGYAAASDVRCGIVLLTFAAAISAAYWSDGSWQAFWLGFAIVFVPMGCFIISNSPNWPIPNFFWINNLFSKQEPSPQYYARTCTIRAIGTLALAMVSGFIGVYIYSQTRKPDHT